MSTFSGIVEEIPGISIDCFNGENENSSAFFLSHCHTDHMDGLGDPFFNNTLKQKNYFLYCSHISKSLLLNILSTTDVNLKNYHIVDLDVDDARIINYVYNNVEYSVSVTPISAGHCPGSVMFLFNYKDKTILYTGDFRINKEDFSKLKSLHYSKQSIPLKIDKVYLDTTFLNLKYLEFPTRVDSLKELCKVAKNWLEKDPKNVIILEISAKYGSEYIYKELAQNLNKKIHVFSDVFDVYSRMDVLKDYVTNICENTSVHACVSKKKNSTNRKNSNVSLENRTDVKKKNILTIIPSAIRWTNENNSKKIKRDQNFEQTINVCYSTHASYNELETFILYFKPKKIFPCVCDEEGKVQILLNKILEKSIVQESDKIECNNADLINVSQFKTVKKSKFKSNYTSSDEDS